MASAITKWVEGEVVTQIELVSQIDQSLTSEEIGWRTEISDFL